ncbi:MULTISPECIES: hypothetical protein [Nostocales]|uniref:Uncharacterized protein n=3 Tax=Nostocales TaxID=1161 RepID=A0A0C1NBH7_9CYAN|nr:hypothetical protein [Tolypothrix bouteillei]KAF3890542.1 hypothetical protein DA73_0400037635 [Tolypothrix bouteillei VB521301]
MSAYNVESYHNCCEFTVPIKLNIPIHIEPTVAIKTPNDVREKLNIHVEPDIYLKPEVKAVQPVCHPQNGYEKYQLPAEQTA